jgi:hypothetical protein
MSARTISPMAPRKVNMPLNVAGRARKSSGLAGLLDSLLWRQPIAVNALVEKRATNAAFLGPLLERLAAAKCFDPVRSAVVARLLTVGRPAAVLGAVRTIIINAVNRVTETRPIAHVVSKGAEVSKPAVTHPNATASIASESLVGGVATAPDHVHPGLIERMLGVSVLGRISRAVLSGIVDHEASTRDGVSAPQVAGDGNDLFAAITPTAPTNAPVVDLLRKFLGHCQPPKSLADQIKGVRRHLSSIHDTNIGAEYALCKRHQ